MMKKKHIYIYLLGILLLSVGCTGKFREFNTDQAGITDDDLLIDDNGFGIRLGIIQQGIYFNYDFEMCIRDRSQPPVRTYGCSKYGRI